MQSEGSLLLASFTVTNSASAGRSKEMKNLKNLTRPGQWAERSWPRVAFVSHALMANDPSTPVITSRLQELGSDWPKEGEDPGFIRWFSFPVVPPAGQKVWVDFYIVPILAPKFLEQVRSGKAYEWVEKVALFAISEAHADGVPLTFGWGALTKLATRHGSLFLERHSELADQFSSTHGDAGTAELNVRGISLTGLKPGFRVAIIGAYGATGDAVSRAIVHHRPASIMLVGKPDEEGDCHNFERLMGLKSKVEVLVPDGQRTEVVIHQDKRTAAIDHQADLVVVATNGMKYMPNEVREGALVFDLTAPLACRAEDGWNGRHLVLTVGCGQFNSQLIPRGFGEISGQRLWDVGAGGSHVLWGCTIETIARRIFGWTGHLAGPDIPMDAVDWSTAHFNQMGLLPQPPISFGRLLSWSAVREFVRRAANPKRSVMGSSVLKRAYP